jgi:hypothetical protein
MICLQSRNPTSQNSPSIIKIVICTLGTNLLRSEPCKWCRRWLYPPLYQCLDEKCLKISYKIVWFQKFFCLICDGTERVQTHQVAKPWGSRAAVLQLLNETVRTQSCPIRKRHPAKNPSETLRKLRGKSQIKNKLLNNM